MNERDDGIEILAKPHDIVLGAGTKFVSRLVDAGTTLVTSGLAASGRPELALMLLRAPAAFPDDQSVDSALDAMAAFLREMAEVAMGSTPMTEGLTMSLANGLVRPQLRGMIWVKPVPCFTDPVVPTNALVGVPLFLDELKVARDTSPYRVLTRLGREIREFPFPPWLDATRSSVARPDAEQSSMLCRMPRLKTDLSFLAEHAESDAHPKYLVRLSLRVRARARAPLMHAFATTPELPGGVAFIGSPSDEANTWLVWEPGQEGFRAVEAPESDFKKISGSFFAVVPDGEFEVDRALMCEDGYMLFPTIASWTRLHAALAGGAPLTLPLEHGRFELVWE